MAEGKWAGLAGTGARLVDLGRPAVFLVPVTKLECFWEREGEMTVRNVLDSFLSRTWGAYTTSQVPTFGIYTMDGGYEEKDECVQYKVSFVGKKHIPALTQLLAEVAVRTGEESIYLEAGQYSCLVYPA